MQLYYVEFEDGCGGYIKEDEYDDFVKAMTLLSVKYTAVIVTEPIYAIHWYDYIDDEWSIIWCTQDNYESNIKDLIEAEVQYEVEAFNV